MLHEILLSLSGHPSPLLRTDLPTTTSFAGLTPPERQLLGTAAHLSDLHVKLITSTAQISASHPSPVCRAVASAIDSLHLAAFQRKVLEVEESILKDDAELVGAYGIVPLTAVMGEFRPWTRRMEWLWELVKFMADEKCHAAAVMDRLRRDLLSGYKDIEETAMSLVAVAEAAWLKQVSAWILYGRLPSFGGQDFFVQKAEAADGSGFTCDSSLLPSFVSTRAASSMLFIGKSLNHVRVKSTIDSGLRGLDHLSSKLRELSNLEFPLDSASFSRTITSIRLSLSENTLQKILPLSKVIEMLLLLREFFLLGRGEFAMALTQEADEKIRNRWRRADNLAYEKVDGLKNVMVKDGEVTAVLGRTWQVLALRESQHAEEDELQELARDLLRLHLNKSKLQVAPGPGLTAEAARLLADSPFQNLLFSTPAILSLQLPSPLDMVLSPSDLQQYSAINVYLLAMRRAHIRLTDLWKITSLRRHHPAPRGGGEFAVQMRQRWTTRMSAMRSSWTTASAAIFFLGETEAYLQTEIVAVLWDGFLDWLVSNNQTPSTDGTAAQGQNDKGVERSPREEQEEEDDDLWLQDGNRQTPQPPSNQLPPASQSSSPPPHDPQTLSTAHKLYINTLTHRLLLTQPSYTKPLYTLLSHIDHLVAHIHRLHSIYTSLDLESDAGVVDAFVNLDAEEADVTRLLRGVEAKVKQGIGDVVAALRKLEVDDEFAAQWESTGVEEAVEGGEEEVGYVPARVGGINRLLMKLDFGTWFGPREGWGDVYA
ncbi:hypothetical protein N3K66_007630 [Trichothecium roseum]|uniref:Uncharacterized protein n=1 Tax=Trichothecium roseum TaxID=47278 RepID=A0ACC0UW67_9HYPO|nr:hypothetical protein N3K66_007630 [Trichothecium roseum]